MLYSLPHRTLWTKYYHLYFMKKLFSLPPSFLFVSLSLVFFQDLSFSAHFINVRGPHNFSLYFFFQSTLLCYLISFLMMASAITHVHIYITQLYLFFDLHTQLSIQQLLLNAQRHIRLHIQNSTHHIPPQICVFLVKSVPLLSIKWLSQKLESILDSCLSHMPPKSVDCFLYHKCILVIVIITALVWAIIISYLDFFRVP